MSFALRHLFVGTRLKLAGVFFLLAAAGARAQAGPPAGTEKVYTLVQQMPKPPGGGGSAAVVALIQQRVIFPRQAMQAHAEGRVFVGFIVAPSGEVGNVAVVKGFRADCDSAAVQAVQQLPRFEPGRQMGRPVPVRFTVPVTFRLRTSQPVAAPRPATFPDSTKRVYTYVERMPLYPGGGVAALRADLLREFQAAGAPTGCPMPTFPVYVNLTVGPSGVIYDVMSLNNLPLISQAEQDAGAKGVVGARPQLQALPAACETALVAAGRRLARCRPGTQNGRPAAVKLTLKLIGPDK